MSKWTNLSKLLSVANDAKSTRKALDVGTNDLTKMLDEGMSPEEAMMRLSDVDPVQVRGTADFEDGMKRVHRNVAKMLGHNQAVARDIPLGNKTTYNDINQLHKQINTTGSNLSVGDYDNMLINKKRISPRGFYNSETNEIAINQNNDPYHALSTYLHENKHANEFLNNPQFKNVVLKKGNRGTPNRLDVSDVDKNDLKAMSKNIPLEQKVQDSFDHFLEPGYFELRKLLDTVIRNKPVVAGTMGAGAMMAGGEESQASELTPQVVTPEQQREQEIIRNVVEQYRDEQRRKLRDDRQQILNQQLQESVESLPIQEQVGLKKPFMQTLDAIGTPQQALFRTIEGAQKGQNPDYSKLIDFDDKLTGADLVENMNINEPYTETALSTLLDAIDPIDLIGAGVFTKGAKNIKNLQHIDSLIEKYPQQAHLLKRLKAFQDNPKAFKKIGEGVEQEAFDLGDYVLKKPKSERKAYNRQADPLEQQAIATELRRKGYGPDTKTVELPDGTYTLQKKVDAFSDDNPVSQYTDIFKEILSENKKKVEEYRRILDAQYEGRKLLNKYKQTDPQNNLIPALERKLKELRAQEIEMEKMGLPSISDEKNTTSIFFDDFSRALKQDAPGIEPDDVHSRNWGLDEGTTPSVFDTGFFRINKELPADSLQPTVDDILSLDDKTELLRKYFEKINN